MEEELQVGFFKELKSKSKSISPLKPIKKHHKDEKPRLELNQVCQTIKQLSHQCDS